MMTVRLNEKPASGDDQGLFFGTGFSWRLRRWNRRRSITLSLPCLGLFGFSQDGVHANDSVEGFGHPDSCNGRDGLLALFHSFITREQQRLRLRESLLLQERFAKHGSRIERRPHVGLFSFSDRQSL